MELEAPVGDRAEVGVEAEERDERVAGDLLRSRPSGVFSTSTVSSEPFPRISRTSAGTTIRTLPSSSSWRAAVTEDSSARKRSRRWTSVIGSFAVSWRPSVQSSAESPPPTITQLLSRKASFWRTK